MPIIPSIYAVMNTSGFVYTNKLVTPSYPLLEAVTILKMTSINFK